MNPLISVIVPCYNQAQYLDECLQSVLDQTYQNWECIIVNDGSPDNTAELAEKWVQQDKRFSYYYSENKGVSNARNIGLDQTNGNFIQFLDSDDTMSADNFAQKIKFAEDFKIIFSDFNILTNNQLLAGYNKLSEELLTFNEIFFNWETVFTIPIHTAIISKSLFDNFRFNTTLTCFEDWLMWLYLAHQNPPVRFIDTPLVAYRKEIEAHKTASGNLEKVVKQRIKVMPLIKEWYGEKLHNQLVYHLLLIKSIENIQLKKELSKIQNGRIISTYLKFKTYLYKKRNQ